MIESLGLTLTQAAVLSLLGLAYLILVFFPFLWPALVMSRKASVVPHRAIFSGLVGLLVYGAFTAISLCVGLPADALLTYIVPQLEDSGYLEERRVLRGVTFLVAYGWLMTPVLLVLLTVGITRQVTPRWERLVIAWSGTHETTPK